MAGFRKLKSGKWQARVVKDGKEVSIGTFRTRKEAEIAAAKVEERIYYGQTLNDRNMLFGEVSQRWLTYQKSRVKESTFKQLEVIVRLHIDQHFASKRIMQVRRDDVRAWMDLYADVKNKKGASKYSIGSRIKYLSVLKGIFHYAVHEMEVLEKSPADRLNVAIKDKSSNRRKVKYYSLNELNKLLDFMQSYKHQRFEAYPLYYMLMYFLSQTGLRISEALALRWTDIQGNQLTVDRQTSRDDNNNLRLTSLKTTASYRTIKLEDDLLQDLRMFKAIQDKLIDENDTFHRNEDGIIFQNYLGNYLTPSTVRDSIRDYCKKAGVAYKGTHGFRHTHAVLLLEAGASLLYVSKRLGHETIRTTADDYSGITKKMEEDELVKFALHVKRKNRIGTKSARDEKNEM